MLKMLKGRKALYIICVYIPMVFQLLRRANASLKQDVLVFKPKGRVILLGDLNARVG